MKALVTGANGLIGSNVVRALLGDGYTVRALVRPNADVSALAGLACEIYPGDVLDAVNVRDAAAGCDLLFHTAVPFAYTGQVAGDIGVTAATGTANVLNAAKATGVSRTVLTSSSVVFGYRTSPEVIDETAGVAQVAGQPAYVAAKIRQDEATLCLAEELGVDVVLVCPTMSVGPFATRLGPSNAIVVQYIADPLRMTYPGGVNVAAVEDVAAGHVLAAEFGKPREHYLLGGDNVTWRQVHETVADLCGLLPPQFVINHTQAFLSAFAEECRARIGHRPPLTTREQAAMVGRYYWYSSAKAAELGYTPRPAREALAGAVAWLASSPHITREMRATMHLHRDAFAPRAATAARERALREVAV
jgi:dihydroflavonol-4-reductase